ncbi:MAG: energy transducer TonB [Bacteroidota bacterium]
MPVPYAIRRQRYRVRLQVGFTLSLAAVLAAFSVPTPERESLDVIATPVEPDSLVVVATMHETPPPPPPPPALPPPVEVVNDAQVLDAVVPPMELGLSDQITVSGPPAPAITAPPPVPTPDAELPPDLPSEPTDEVVEFLPLEDQPVLIGGIEGLQERTEYPEAALRVGIQGTVYVRFVVDETGRVVDPVAVRSPHPLLSEAALSAVAASTFEPGRQRGRPVRARFTLPVRFVLR